MYTSIIVTKIELFYDELNLRTDISFVSALQFDSHNLNRIR